MIQSICILGRQPSLGLAELESLYGANHVSPTQTQVAGLDLASSDIDFATLGGSTKLATVLAEAPNFDPKNIEKLLVNLCRSNALQAAESGKFHLGISAIGANFTPAKLTALGLTLKKVLRTDSRSVRIVPNVAAELSTAQVFHNHLTDERGAEIVIVRTKNGGTVIARTVAVQDIDSYTIRDRSRPKRDSRVGMLPPKLAQIIINLATGSQANALVLDPFCGTGVVLQESLLAGHSAYGTDLEPRMIDYTDVNLDWAIKTLNPKASAFKTEVGDATTHQWEFPSDAKIVIAGETYLGRPFTSLPARDILEQTVSDVNLIIKKFLNNITDQIPKGTRLCLAVPAWQTRPHTFRHLPLVDSLKELGFTRVELTHADYKNLIYYRDDQTVGRELLILTKS